MRIAFVVERPTQFEAPFYRFAAGDPEHRLKVFFTRPQPAAAIFDPELGRDVSWGFDLTGGYEHEVVPPRSAWSWLRRAFGRESFDLVIVNGYTRPAYLAAALAARRRGLATGLRLDSALWPGDTSPQRVHRLLFALLLRRLFYLFFGVGSLTLAYLRRCGVAEERIALFPYAVDVEHFRRGAALTPRERAEVRRRCGLPAGGPAVLAVAKLSEREAPWDLLRALGRLDSPPPLALAGDGPLRGVVEAFVRERGLSAVRLLGYVPYPELPALYGASSLFVHAPREERWGVSVAEALAAGLPVVAGTRVGAGHDLIVPGENGFLYPTGDDGELARRLGDALALSREGVGRRSRDVLAGWDYAAAWRGIVAAAEAARGYRER